MKKITVLVAVMLVFVLSFNVCAASIVNIYENYTQNMDITFSFDNADNLISLLNEIEMPRQIEDYISVKDVLEGLLSGSSSTEVRMNASPDFKKVEISVSAVNNGKVKINKNMTVTAEMKNAVWFKLNLNPDEREFLIITDGAYNNKYVVFDYSLLTDEEKVEMDYLFEYYDKIFDREYLEELGQKCDAIINENAEVKTVGKNTTVKFNNETLRKIFAATNELIEKNPFADSEVIDETEKITKIMEKVDFLGKNGLVCKYTYDGSGKIIAFDMDCDICVDIAGIYEILTDSEWSKINDGKLAFTVKATGKAGSYGTTKVEFPTLNENNTAFDISDFLVAAFLNDRSSSLAEFHDSGWVEANTDNMFKEDGTCYVSYREFTEAAFGSSAVTEYDNGSIVTTFTDVPRFREVSFAVDGDRAYVDGAEFETDRIIMRDGKVYVGEKFISNVFGYGLYSADYDLIKKLYCYEFERITASDYDYESEEDEAVDNLYIWIWSDKLPVMGEEIYVPLRDALESGFNENVTIDYDNGNVTVNISNYANASCIKLAVGEDKIYADGKEYTMSAPVLEDGKVYITEKFFEEIFGVTIQNAQYNLIDEEYMCFMESAVVY